MLCSAIMASTVAGCSQKQTPPPPPKSADKSLIDVVNDAANFYASGGTTFTPPAGISIETRRNIPLDIGGKKVDSIEIKGSQQKNVSKALIIFHFPESWLAAEQQNLAGLKDEMKDLSACAQKLVDEGQQNSPKDKQDSCTMKEIHEGNIQGIEIRDKNVRHIQMLLLANQ
jgi:hypothetical protein